MFICRIFLAIPERGFEALAVTRIISSISLMPVRGLSCMPARNVVSADELLHILFYNYTILKAQLLYNCTLNAIGYHFNE